MGEWVYLAQNLGGEMSKLMQKREARRVDSFYLNFFISVQLDQNLVHVSR